MKLSINSHLRKLNSAFFTLGIVVLLFFSLAFACGDSDEIGGGDNPGYQPSSNERPRPTRSGAPTEADVAAYVNEYEQMQNPTGMSSSEPTSVSVSVQRISFESPRQANEGDRLRKVASDYLYPVVVEYTLNLTFNDGTHSRNKKYKFELYRNQQGGWSAFQYGPA